MKKCLPLMLSVLVLGGCGLTPQGDALRSAVKDRGAKVMDEGLENSEYFICEVASHGSVKRRYGVSEKLASAYDTLCERNLEGVTVRVK